MHHLWKSSSSRGLLCLVGRRPSAAAAFCAFSRSPRSLQRRLVGGRSSTTDGTLSLVRRSRLEAVLFLAREPLSLRKLAQMANLADATEARTALKHLRGRYDERGCAFQVAQVAGGHQLLSRREFAQWLRPQRASEREIRLSPPPWRRFPWWRIGSRCCGPRWKPSAAWLVAKYCGC